MDAAAADLAAAPSRRPDWRFALAHPAHLVALGFGAGLAPWAPGTVGTLWAWAAAALLWPWLGAGGWALLVASALPLSAWSAARCARALGVADPGAIVADEIVAFWLVWAVVAPAGLAMQAAAFVLFRVFDAAKPGPVGWADRALKPRAGQAIGWRAGVGIVLDDLVAAGCTLLALALGVQAWRLVSR